MEEKILFCKSLIKKTIFKFVDSFSKLLCVLSWRYRKHKESEKIRIVFVLTFHFNLDCFLTIYNELINDDLVEVKVLADDYQNEVSGLLPSHALNLNNIEFTRDSEVLVKSFKPHVVFLAESNSLRSGAWPQYSRARLVYIPYGISISAAEYSKHEQYNRWLHNHAWMIFVSDEFFKNLYGKYCSRGNNHVMVSGHPKNEIMLSKIHRPCVDGDLSLLCKKKKVPDRPIVFLWNIQFRDGLWSTWNEYGDKILDIFNKREDLLLICRPHPFFFSAFEAPDRPGYIRNKILNNKNTILDESASMVDAFLKCDALLTDASSIIYDFWWTFKPMLYLRVERSENLHAHAFRLIKTYHAIGDNFDKIDIFINSVCSQIRDARNDDLWATPRLNEMLSPEGAGKRIAETVIQGVRANVIL